MDDFSILLGARTGDGIPQIGEWLCKLFSHLGYYIYMNNDYPSIIAGGHQFVEIRAGIKKISAHSGQIDVLVAFNQDALDVHQNRWHPDTVVLYNSDRDKLEKEHQQAVQISVKELSGETKADQLTEQMMMLGALIKTLGISLEKALSDWPEQWQDTIDKRSKALKSGFDAAETKRPVPEGRAPVLPVVAGTDAISLGLLQSGLQAYVAYPMTPTSPILEFMAKHEPHLDLLVSLPENEIAVMIQALGFAYMGVRTAVGTSGGGFSLMVEGLSLAGQAELPVTIILGQRAGPATGMPTYTSQSDLSFALSAGHGEFPRIVVAPGDAEEAFYWSAQAVNLSWKYQVPAIVLVDKTLCINLYSFDSRLIPAVSKETELLWDREGTYARYQQTESGISPLAYPPVAGQAVKSNSYVHDEKGMTSELAADASAVVEKRFRKMDRMAREIDDYEPVKVFGEGEKVLLTWGSNKGACLEIAQRLGMRMVQVMVMSPFPVKAVEKALAGAEQVICVEGNFQGQLMNLIKQYGFSVDHRTGLYDGRPMSVEDLENEVKKVMK